MLIVFGYRRIIPLPPDNLISERMVSVMSDNKIFKDSYDDGNIPEIDLPQSTSGSTWNPEPLPESSRPRKDGPGGDGTP